MLAEVGVALCFAVMNFSNLERLVKHAVHQRVRFYYIYVYHVVST
jgi:hypothetical protein